MKIPVIALIFAALSTMPQVLAQPAPGNQVYERILCVVPMVGKGTWEDPRRPMFAPTREETRNKRQTATPVTGKDRYLNTSAEIIGYHFQVSDDGKFALVEFYASDNKAFSSILASRGPNVKVFERGKSEKTDVEEEFKKYKRDFNWDS